MEILRKVIRNVPDFPKPGIQFKDITTLLQQPELGTVVVKGFTDHLKGQKIDAVIGIESRGFIYGYAVAAALNVPFIPIRKAGKLPAETISQEYDLEYGSAKIEIHKDALQPGMRVFIHDDLLATGGTAAAAAMLCKKLGAEIAAFGFIVELDALQGRACLLPFCDNIISLVNYSD